MFNKKPPEGPRKDWLTSATEPEAATRHFQDRQAHAVEMRSGTMGFDERKGRAQGTVVDLGVKFREPVQAQILPSRPAPITAEEQASFTADVRAALQPEQPRVGLLSLIGKLTRG